METKLVIFDMDGLMFDTENMCIKGWSRAIKEMGYVPDRQIYIESIGLSDEQIFARYYGPELDLKHLYDKTEQYLREIIETEGMAVKEGLFALIAFLDANGIKKAVASSSTMDTILYNLDKGGVANTFDYIISGRELENGKPDPEIFIRVCQQLDMPRENAIVLEDSLNGVRAAYAAGIDCVAIPDLVPVDDEMKSKAYQIVENLNDVIGILKKRNHLNEDLS